VAGWQHWNRTAMKKRLRKKKHLGEFTEWGVPVAIARKRKDDFDSFLDDFLALLHRTHFFY
jgi:uncharacterized protein YggL (DUF469 family)